MSKNARRIVLYADIGDNFNVNQLLHWLLYDPLLVSEVSLEIDVIGSEQIGAVSYIFFFQLVRHLLRVGDVLYIILADTLEALPHLLKTIH